jgi:hypothetical protein
LTGILIPKRHKTKHYAMPHLLWNSKAKMIDVVTKRNIPGRPRKIPLGSFMKKKKILYTFDHKKA